MDDFTFHIALYIILTVTFYLYHQCSGRNPPSPEAKRRGHSENDTLNVSHSADSPTNSIAVEVPASETQALDTAGMDTSSNDVVRSEVKNVILSVKKCCCTSTVFISRGSQTEFNLLYARVDSCVSEGGVPEVPVSPEQFADAPSEADMCVDTYSSNETTALSGGVVVNCRENSTNPVPVLVRTRGARVQVTKEYDLVTLPTDRHRDFEDTSDDGTDIDLDHYVDPMHAADEYTDPRSAENMDSTPPWCARPSQGSDPREDSLSANGEESDDSRLFVDNEASDYYICNGAFPGPQDSVVAPPPVAQSQSLSPDSGLQNTEEQSVPDRPDEENPVASPSGRWLNREVLVARAEGTDHSEAGSLDDNPPVEPDAIYVNGDAFQESGEDRGSVVNNDVSEAEENVSDVNTCNPECGHLASSTFDYRIGPGYIQRVPVAPGIGRGGWFTEGPPINNQSRYNPPPLVPLPLAITASQNAFRHMSLECLAQFMSMLQGHLSQSNRQPSVHVPRPPAYTSDPPQYSDIPHNPPPAYSLVDPIVAQTETLVTQTSAEENSQQQSALPTPAESEAEMTPASRSPHGPGDERVLGSQFWGRPNWPQHRMRLLGWNGMEESVHPCRRGSRSAERQNRQQAGVSQGTEGSDTAPVTRHLDRVNHRDQPGVSGETPPSPPRRHRGARDASQSSPHSSPDGAQHVNMSEQGRQCSGSSPAPNCDGAACPPSQTAHAVNSSSPVRNEEHAVSVSDTSHAEQSCGEPSRQDSREADQANYVLSVSDTSHAEQSCGQPSRQDSRRADQANYVLSVSDTSHAEQNCGQPSRQDSRQADQSNYVFPIPFLSHPVFGGTFEQHRDRIARWFGSQRSADPDEET